MTSHKLYVLVCKFEDALIGKFGKREPARSESYTGVFTPEVQETDIQHLYWMTNEMKDLIKKDRIPKAMRWLGFIQHATLSLGLADLNGIKEMSRDSDEANFPPPANMNTMAAKIHVLILTPVGVLTVLVRQTWLPQGLQPQFVKWPNIDPDGRLNVLGDLGVRLQWEVATREWDYSDCSLNLFLRPTMVGLHLCEESVALVIGLYRQAGWEYQDDKAREWGVRLEEHKKQAGLGHSPDCPHHPQHPQHPFTAQQPPMGPMGPVGGPGVPGVPGFPPGMIPPGATMVFGQGPMPPGAVPVPPGLFGQMMSGMLSPEFDPTSGSYVDDDDDEDEEEEQPRPKKRKKRRKPKPEQGDGGLQDTQ